MGRGPHGGAPIGDVRRLVSMTTTDATLASLYRALGIWQEGELPRSPGWEKFAHRFLQPGERVLLALEGQGWTWVRPLLLVTDRRVLRLREALGWRLLREVPASEVAGAEHVSRLLLFDSVRIHLRGGSSIRMHPDPTPGEPKAQNFVAGVNALVAGRGPSMHR